MSIRSYLDEAAFLLQRNRFDIALLISLTAVAASSRKALPKGTRSLVNPKEAMGDGEAFKLFLGGQIKRLVLSDTISPEFDEQPLFMTWSGRTLSLPALIYSAFRCPLVHNAELPLGVRVAAKRPSPHAGWGEILIDAGMCKLELWQRGSMIELSPDTIDLFIAASRYARCNVDEFGPLPPLELGNVRLFSPRRA